MGKGGSTPTDTTQRTTNLPEYADPYFRRLLQGAEEATMPFYPDDPERYGDDAGKTTYQPYEGERLARSGDYQDIMASRDMIRNIARAGIPGMPQAIGAGMDALGYQRDALAGISGLADYQTGKFDPYGGFQETGFSQAKFDPYSDFRMANYNEYEFAEPEQFTGGAVEQYMSPYMQAVVERQKQSAQEDYARQANQRAAQAVSEGAFGGSRAAVTEALASRSMNEQLQDIEARGLQSAYEQAAGQFESDRAARMAAEKDRAAELARVQAGRAGELGRVQTGEAGELARIQQGAAGELDRYEGATAAERSRLQAAEAAELARIQAAKEASRQYGSGFGLDAYNALGTGAGNLASLGTGLMGIGERGRAADIQNAQLLEALGGGIRAEDQALLDLKYEDFVRQRDYPISQYERYAGILRGVPVTPDVEQQRFAAYNPVQQALGAGISALGLYKGLQ